MNRQRHIRNIVKLFHIISGTFKLFLILFWYQEHERNVPDIAQSTHGIRNIFADIRNVPTRPHMVLGMFLLPFSVSRSRFFPRRDSEKSLLLSAAQKTT